MAEVPSIKVYVQVKADFRADGIMIPTSLIWEDGMHYEIDKVTDIRQAAAMKAGGQGDRYTIWVNGKPTYLFFERSTAITGNMIGRWFVERRIPQYINTTEGANPTKLAKRLQTSGSRATSFLYEFHMTLRLTQDVL